MEHLRRYAKIMAQVRILVESTSGKGAYAFKRNAIIPPPSSFVQTSVMTTVLGFNHNYLVPTPRASKLRRDLAINTKPMHPTPTIPEISKVRARAAAGIAVHRHYRNHSSALFFSSNLHIEGDRNSLLQPCVIDFNLMLVLGF